LAFSTIQGSGGAPDSFVGTSGVDSIAIANSDGNFFVGGQEANDLITSVDSGSALYPGVLSNATAKGGQGADTITITGSGNGSIFISTFINGNSNGDTINVANGAGDVISVSTVQGGQGNDTLNVGLTGSATSIFVNGNVNADTITSGGASSTIYGGQGNDTLRIFAPGSATISGDNDNDNIALTDNVGINNATFLGGQGNDTISVALRTTGTDSIRIYGNDGTDTITGTGAGATGNTTIDGGAGIDFITTNVAGTTTVNGGDGSDTIANDGATINWYTSATEGGSFSGSTSTAAIGGAYDTITGFLIAADAIAFSASALTGTASVAVANGAPTAANFNTTGVIAYTAAASGLTDLSTYANVLTALNTAGANSFTGDAGDIGYVFLEDTAGVGYQLFAVQLGSTKAGVALNNSDNIAFVADFATSADVTAANFRFYA